MKTRIARTIAMFMGGRTQKFLGTSLISPLLRWTPENRRGRVALSILDLSPHYFYRTAENQSLPKNKYLEFESNRNLESRRALFEQVLRKYLDRDQTVLDYGCGPGYLAWWVSTAVSQVWACDISRGVLACAKVVNSANNIHYLSVDKRGIPVPDGCVDFIYSFAVIQHVTDEVFKKLLAEWHRVLKPGGRVFVHIVVDDPKWESEEEWRSDRTFGGRAKWMLGLHCFGRKSRDVRSWIRQAGFDDPIVGMVGELAPDLRDDVAAQNYFEFSKRPADGVRKNEPVEMSVIGQN
jgi:ubiquinone/menaquinone biosynthesis C-methylase UbiE